MSMAIQKIKVSETVELHFRARMDYRVTPMQLPTGAKAYARLYYFIYDRRVDEAQVLVMPSCLTFPLTFHGCLTAAAAIIKVGNSENLVYEHDSDVVLDPRSIIQQTAHSYGVDPSEMMARYSEVRPYLVNTGIEVPNSIEETLNTLKIRGGTDIKGKN
jgi:hypothetical protein